MFWRKSVAKINEVKKEDTKPDTKGDPKSQPKTPERVTTPVDESLLTRDGKDSDPGPRLNNATFERHEEERKRIANQYTRQIESGEEMEEMDQVLFEEEVKKVRRTFHQDYPDVFSYAWLEPHTELLLINDDIVFEHNVVKEASIDKLIEYATLPTVTDGHFVDEFQLVFRSFLSTKELFEKIIARWNTLPQLPSQFPKDDFISWRNENLNIIRIRCTAFVRRWMEKHFLDFETEEALSLLQQFIDMVKKTENRLGDQLSKGRDVAQYMLTVKKIAPDTSKYPKSIIPEENRQFLQNWDPVEIARQITLHEFEMFSKIEPYEFMNQRWTKPNKEKEAPNITNMIRWFNKINIYLVGFVLTEPGLKKRAERMTLVYKIADELRKLKNFNGVFEIGCVLAHQATHRLKKTWEACGGDSFVKKVEEVQSVTSSEKNFANLRGSINPTSSCIPYIGMFFTDMIMLDEGNKSYAGDLINYTKCRKIAKTLNAIKAYQHIPFEFAEVPALKSILMDISNSNDVSDKDLYEISLLIEPRIVTPSTSLTKPGKNKPEKLQKKNSVSNIEKQGDSTSTSREGSPRSSRAESRGSRSFGDITDLDVDSLPVEIVAKRARNDTNRVLVGNMMEMGQTDEFMANALGISEEELKAHHVYLSNRVYVTEKNLLLINAVEKLIKLEWTNEMISKAIGCTMEQITSMREDKSDRSDSRSDNVTPAPIEDVPESVVEEIQEGVPEGEPTQDRLNVPGVSEVNESQ
jgi:hypothetical protein